MASSNSIKNNSVNVNINSSKTVHERQQFNSMTSQQNRKSNVENSIKFDGDIQRNTFLGLKSKVIWRFDLFFWEFLGPDRDFLDMGSVPREGRFE